jgi:hypothetical protein
VLAGSDAGSMQEVGSAPWDGLETRIRVADTSSPLVQVQALDASGQVMSGSAAIEPKR